MSANLVVDLGNNCILATSLPSTLGVATSSGGVISSQSGTVVGDIVDLLHGDTYCNVLVAGRVIVSGILTIAVQTSDSTASGTFTNPMSGLTVPPGAFTSAGHLIIGSGGGGALGPAASGQFVMSGFMVSQGFNRPHRYARLVSLSGTAVTTSFQAGFITQLRTTGSGGGFTLSPSSGTVNV